MKQYLSLALLGILPHMLLSEEIPLPKTSEMLTLVTERRPGHEHDQEILTAAFCEILIHGAAAITAKDDRDTQIKEAAIVAATIVNMLQLASRSVPHDSSARVLERTIAIEKLGNMLNEMLQNSEFLQTLKTT